MSHYGYYFPELSPVFAACRINRQECLADRHSKLISVSSFNCPAAIVLSDTVITYKPHRHGDSDSIEVSIELPSNNYEYVAYSSQEPIYIRDSQCHFKILYDRYRLSPLDISIIPLTGFPSTDVLQYFGVYTYNIWGINVIPGHDITVQIPSLTPSIMNERFLHNANLLIEDDTLSVYYYKFHRNHEPADSLRKYLNPNLWPRNYNKQKH